MPTTTLCRPRIDEEWLETKQPGAFGLSRNKKCLSRDEIMSTLRPLLTNNEHRKAHREINKRILNLGHEL